MPSIDVRNYESKQAAGLLNVVVWSIVDFSYLIIHQFIFEMQTKTFSILCFALGLGLASFSAEIRFSIWKMLGLFSFLFGLLLSSDLLVFF